MAVRIEPSRDRSAQRSRIALVGALALAGSLAAAGLPGCRAVVGLDDLEFEDDSIAGPTSTLGAGGAGSASGAGGDGGHGSGCPVAPILRAPGASIWVQTSVSPHPVLPGGAAVGPCGDVWVTGTFTDTMSISQCTISSGSMFEAVFWAKLDAATGACKAAGHFAGQEKGSAKGKAIATDSEGNAVLVGTFREGFSTPGGVMTSLNAGDDIFVIKLDPGGAFLWARQFQGALDDSANAVAVHPSQGSIFVGGSFRTTIVIPPGTEVKAASQGADVLLVKLTPEGDAAWGLGFGSPGDDAANGLSIANPGGDIALTGTFSGAMNILEEGVMSSGETDVFAAVIGSGGKGCSFAFAPSATWSAVGRSAAFADPGGSRLVIGGNFAGQATFGATQLMSHLGDTDGFVALLDTSGSEHVATRIGPTDGLPPIQPDRVSGVAVDPTSGDLLIAGTFWHTVVVGTSEVTSADADDILIAKLSPDFTTSWARSIGGPGQQEASSIAVDPGSGAAVVVGSFLGDVDFGFGGQQVDSPLKRLFVLKLAP